mmetsp:Transcript_84710/g.229901  ORF Transcript_84710/g.229901 Transcript_84710/m.229901 type:complete len:306 (+) Transcript_84710:60-977(+)
MAAPPRVGSGAAAALLRWGGAASARGGPRLHSWSSLAAAPLPLACRAAEAHAQSTGRSSPGLAAALAAAGAAAGAVGFVHCPATACDEEPGTKDPAARAFFLRLQVVPFGVLGTRLMVDKSVRRTATAPDATTAILDSGGHGVPTKGGPKRAGGASKAIYTWVGIAEQESFPPDVSAAVIGNTDCKYHDYGEGRHVIHAYGPDLRKMPDAWDTAVEVLASTYCNILREFLDSGLPNLRLLPVSGGILVGQYQKQMPELTIAALRRGFLMLPVRQQAIIVGRHVDLCIFLEAELGEFEAVGRAACS